MAVKVKVSSGALEEGRHTGVVTKFETRDDPYEYIDFFIKSGEVELKYSTTPKLTPDNKLGRFLDAMGVNVKELVASNANKEIDMEAVLKSLIGKKVSFMAKHEKTGKGTFSRIVDDSIRLS